MEGWSRKEEEGREEKGRKQRVGSRLTAHENLVLKRRSECAGSSLLHRLLDLSPDPTHCPDNRALELGDFQLRVEHAVDEGGALEDLARIAHQLQLLHRSEGGVQL